MSGHSKWATTKHKKAAQDKTRGKLFAKIIRQVEVAARDGGGDPDANPTLRTMFQKARDASIPMDTIKTAIKRGTGDLEGVRYEAINYEGYAPCGVAVYVEVLSDNRNRTGADVRSVFSKLGGSIAEPGSVSWQFDRKGILVVAKAAATEDDLMDAGLDAGLEDVDDQGDEWQMTSAPGDLHGLRQALEDAGITVASADLLMVANQTVPLDNEGDARKVLRLLDALDEIDDVQNVYANFDIPDAVLESVSRVGRRLMPGVGDSAPAFTLAGTGGRPYTLAEYRGRVVVLVFYPGDNTPVCTHQLATYTREIGQFDGIGAQILAISPQTVESHEKFAADQGGFGFPLLADVDKAVGRLYQILGPLGFYRRSVFVIDHEGVIRYAHRAVAGLSFRPVAELVGAVQAIHR